jgi:hypothetical protein
MTRLLFILLLLLQFSCGRGDVDSFPAHRGGDVSLPVGFVGGERYKPRLQYVSAGDTIVELSFLYVKEHDGVVEWEEGTVKFPLSVIRQHARPAIFCGEAERGGLP